MEWRGVAKSGRLPTGIPKAPNYVYRGKGWRGFGDWLGTGNIASRQVEYLAFKEARRFVRALGLRSTKEWRAYSKSGKRPADIPANPDKTYCENGWRGYGDWLETQGDSKRN